MEIKKFEMYRDGGTIELDTDKTIDWWKQNFIKQKKICKIYELPRLPPNQSHLMTQSSQMCFRDSKIYKQSL